MRTTELVKRTSICAKIGNNNKHVNIFVKENEQKVELTNLKVENIQLRNLLELALMQIKLKDEIIDALTN